MKSRATTAEDTIRLWNKTATASQNHKTWVKQLHPPTVEGTEAGNGVWKRCVSKSQGPWIHAHNHKVSIPNAANAAFTTSNIEVQDAHTNMCWQQHKIHREKEM